MGKADKLLEKMRNNPSDWRIDDLKVIANKFDLKFRQPGTSHVTFSKGRYRLTVPSHKPIKKVYVKKFILMIDSLEEDNDYD